MPISSALKQAVHTLINSLVTHHSGANIGDGEICLVHCITVYDELVEFFPDDVRRHPAPKPAQGALCVLVPTT
jgi:hypothetical protein